jgi:hypothetical protein
VLDRAQGGVAGARPALFVLGASAQGAIAVAEPVQAAIADYRRALVLRPESIAARWRLLRALFFRASFCGSEPEQRQRLFEEARHLADEGVARLERVAGGRKGAARAGAPGRIRDLARELLARCAHAEPHAEYRVEDTHYAHSPVGCWRRPDRSLDVFSHSATRRSGAKGVLFRGRFRKTRRPRSATRIGARVSRPRPTPASAARPGWQAACSL